MGGLLKVLLKRLLGKPRDHEHHHDIESVKEILRDQLELAHGGYEKFSDSLGETAVDEKKFREDFEKWLTLDGQKESLQYYANWLNENPEGETKMGASPNKEISAWSLEISNRMSIS